MANINSLPYTNCSLERGPGQRGSECAICQAEMSAEETTVCHSNGTCLNSFHEECFGNWASSCTNSGANVTCPFCRAVLLSFRDLPIPSATPQDNQSSDSDFYDHEQGSDSNSESDSDSDWEAPPTREGYPSWTQGPRGRRNSGDEMVSYPPFAPAGPAAHFASDDGVRYNIVDDYFRRAIQRAMREGPGEFHQQFRQNPYIENGHVSHDQLRRLSQTHVARRYLELMNTYFGVHRYICYQLNPELIDRRNGTGGRMRLVLVVPDWTGRLSSRVRDPPTFPRMPRWLYPRIGNQVASTREPPSSAEPPSWFMVQHPDHQHRLLRGFPEDVFGYSPVAYPSR